ncbi:MAG TPA: energy transducer TonB [Methylomirabilota bacterium]|nr:energy transducer TonB [Methylomirabilota bacterium]
MPSESRNALEAVHEESLGSLRACFVDGDGEQQTRERRVRRRALVISVSIQSLCLAAILIVPLFGKTERFVGKEYVPIPPYSPYHGSSHGTGSHDPAHGQKTACHFCQPQRIPTGIVTQDSHPSTNGSDEPVGDLLPGVPGVPDGLIPIPDSRATVRPPQPSESHAKPKIIHITQLDPARLVRRVEPVYPTLAKQIHKEGKVELRAIIATDGTIQSLEIVSGDPIFYLSAREAVSQWRYQPTILNGQVVEVETYITVIYVMQH